MRPRTIAEVGLPQTGTPLIARSKTPLDSPPVDVLRYDEARQRSQVFVSGVWVDSTQAPVALAATRMTKVAHETSDDR